MSSSAAIANFALRFAGWSQTCHPGRRLQILQCHAISNIAALAVVGLPLDINVGLMFTPTDLRKCAHYDPANDEPLWLGRGLKHQPRTSNLKAGTAAKMHVVVFF